MNSRTWSRKPIAFALAVAVLSVYSMVALAAAPGTLAGELSVSGQVTVDGQTATNGGTVFSGSTITTGPDSSAVVSLGKVGRVELAANSVLKLDFTEGGMSGSLANGRVKVSSNSGASAIVTTKDGSAVADMAQANVFTVDTECNNMHVATQSGVVALRGAGVDQQIAAGRDAAAGQAAPGTRCTRLAAAPAFSSLSGGALAALLLAAGGAVVGAVIAGTSGNNNVDLGGGVVVVSPSR